MSLALATEKSPTPCNLQHFTLDSTQLVPLLCQTLPSPQSPSAACCVLRFEPTDATSAVSRIALWPSRKEMEPEFGVDLVMHQFKRLRGHEPQGGVKADAVVEHFQVLEDLRPHLIAGGEHLVRTQLPLEAPEERLDRGVVPALAHPRCRQPPQIGVHLLEQLGGRRHGSSCHGRRGIRGTRPAGLGNTSPRPVSLSQGTTQSACRPCHATRCMSSPSSSRATATSRHEPFVPATVSGRWWQAGCRWRRATGVGRGCDP